MLDEIARAIKTGEDFRELKMWLNLINSEVNKVVVKNMMIWRNDIEIDINDEINKITTNLFFLTRLTIIKYRKKRRTMISIVSRSVSEMS